MPTYKSKFARAWAFRVPFQEVLDLGRLSIFIDAEDADIEIEARVLEVIRIAAVEGRLLLGGEDNPHIVITLVTIEMVNAALIKSDHVGAQAGFLFAFLFNRRNRVATRRVGLLGRHFGFDDAAHARGYVFHRHQNIDRKSTRLNSSHLV